MYTYNRGTSICIDLSKIKLFVFVIRNRIRTMVFNVQYFSSASISYQDG